ncbi:SLC13 family permease [Nocardioides sp.]|uniref:SLC13 family permease n=1 Tax=Nocardioides sp. TaxID=35761 RepID=UPI00286B3B64|nr:SLC13 family permease [Nocardioides sp.]
MSQARHDRVSTLPPAALARADAPQVVTGRSLVRSRILRRLLLGAVGLLALVGLAAAIGNRDASLDGDAGTTLVVFVLAVWAWVFTRLDDTYVALGAAVALVLAGVISTDTFFATLGDETVWLLLGAFVIAAGVTRSGLADRAAAFMVAPARSPRQLVHLVTAALVVTTFAVPSTSGRAALVLPVFLALARTLGHLPQLVRALAVLFPTVILLTAVGSLLGAGAHLVTSQVLLTATGEGISFVQWLILGLPLAIVSAHVSAEIVLALFADRATRRARISLEVHDFARPGAPPVTGPLSVAESRAALLVATAVGLWCTEPLHGIHPAIVALLGALVATSPRLGAVPLGEALKSAPWSLLLFLAATLALGSALTSSGAATWLAEGALGGFSGAGAAVPFLVVVIIASTALHLVVQSRSARSSVLIPIVVALAPAAGVDPAAAAFASTAAAGFCHTLPASAKPVALFARVEEVETFAPRDLLRLSAVLAPVTAGLVLLFSLLVWPVLGLSLTP